jgi:hypothetical protein
LYVELSLMCRLDRRRKARTIFLALASAHHVLKCADEFPISVINKRRNFRALILQVLAFSTNSQLVGNIHLIFIVHSMLLS